MRVRSGNRPVVVLTGPAGCRPEGMERLLISAGFQLMEVTAPDGLPPRPDLILLTIGPLDEHLQVLSDTLAAARSSSAQVVVVVNGGTMMDLVRLAEAGVDDALVWPVTNHDELVARIWARILSPRRYGIGPADADLKLHAVLEQVVREVHRDEVIVALVRALATNLEIQGVRFILHDGETSTGRLAAANRFHPHGDGETVMEEWPEAMEAARCRESVLIRNVGADPRFGKLFGDARDQRIDSAAAVPMAINGDVLGVLVIRSRAGEPSLSGSMVAFAELAVSVTSRLLEADERRGKIARLQGAAGRIDLLTGCSTLDALDQRLREEFERARRYAVPFSLVLLDVDGMARINERLGRDGGNRVLAWLGRVLQSELRSPDFVARYGGEEFLLLLPQTDLPGARRAVGRVRESLAGYQSAAPSRGATCSVTAGIVTYPKPNVTRPEELFPLLEAAMLEGKREPSERIGVAA